MSDHLLGLDVLVGDMGTGGAPSAPMWTGERVTLPPMTIEARGPKAPEKKKPPPGVPVDPYAALLPPGERPAAPATPPAPESGVLAWLNRPAWTGAPIKRWQGGLAVAGLAAIAFGVTIWASGTAPGRRMEAARRSLIAAGGRW